MQLMDEPEDASVGLSSFIFHSLGLRQWMREGTLLIVVSCFIVPTGRMTLIIIQNHSTIDGL